ncbi:hypothetical protein RvY_04816 [Ramazzottius varieornatus]|uniref:Uncharacterized protein n=1 Tax=Ramazzottius varieornatus TaxID=947166 RepID=A0A1D1USX5_RAMVA|nr:hypothetical protein RvY_04816 [Ramazzottius varieornatus]
MTASDLERSLPSRGRCSSLGQPGKVATAPSLRLHFGLPFNAEGEAPFSHTETPSSSFASKFNPLHNTSYSQFTKHLSNTQLSASPPKISINSIEFKRPSFSAEGDDHVSFVSGPCSRLGVAEVPTMSVSACDTPEDTPRGTPRASPTLLRKKNVEVSQQKFTRSGSTGFLGWLTRPGETPVQEESQFFHQKEDMTSLQKLLGAHNKKPRFTMGSVSLADLNVITPSEY